MSWLWAVGEFCEEAKRGHNMGDGRSARIAKWIYDHDEWIGTSLYKCTQKEFDNNLPTMEDLFQNAINVVSVAHLLLTKTYNLLILVLAGCQLFSSKSITTLGHPPYH